MHRLKVPFFAHNHHAVWLGFSRLAAEINLWGDLREFGLPNPITFPNQPPGENISHVSFAATELHILTARAKR